MDGFRDLVCDDVARRARLALDRDLNGIDYLEVVTAPPVDNQLVLRVFFIPKAMPDPVELAAATAGFETMLDGLDGATGAVTITGGTRIRSIRVTAVARVGDHLRVRVEEPGDFSTYTLTIASAALDPAYASLDFSFKAGCPSRFDCRPRTICPPPPRDEPAIDYLAKDYASFRRALIDLIPTLVPGWTERHEADLGIALVELLAYVGDQLSYYQDAVATEAYLATARQRISVKRHARLIDYRMHDGASARAFVHLDLEAGAAGVLPAGSEVLSRIVTPLGATTAAPGAVIPDALAAPALTAAEVVFETMAEVQLDGRLSRIPIHAWGNRECCLPRWATGVDLRGDLAFDPAIHALPSWRLKPGDFLLLEEAVSPVTGRETDADPDHRQVVRLVRVERTRDPLLGFDLTRVAWDHADALRFPLCLSARTDGGVELPEVSVARGNLALADHGRTRREFHPGDPADPRAPGLRTGDRPYRFHLQEGPTSFRIAIPPAAGTVVPVATLTAADALQAVPEVDLVAVTPGGRRDPWEARPDLLGSDQFARDFVVDVDHAGRAVLRFGDGEHGAPPPENAKLDITYRVGVGSPGNVGAEALAHVVARAPLPATRRVRNPLPAFGGIDPEPIERVKLLAPPAIHADELQFRAVTEADYARAAAKHPEVAKAVATFRWTGSWQTVFLTIDPVGRVDLPPELERRVLAWVSRFMQTGYDLEIEPPLFVPLEIEVDVCVARGHFRGQVEAALLAALGSRPLPGGGRGFFHPDRFTFGQPLYLSQLYAAIEAVAGVDSAVVTVFRRFGKAANGELECGVIPIGQREIVRLDNDPSEPENGVLRLRMLGLT